MDYGLKNKHVLITGSNGGIGFSTAKKFLKLGSKVSLHYHKNNSNVIKLHKKYEKSSCLINSDVRNEKEVIDCIEKGKKLLGTIEILIINHAVFPEDDVGICEMSLDQWKNTIDINLTGSFLFAREFLKQLKDANKDKEKEEDIINGNIVIIGSTSALFGESGHIDYSSSKSALTYGFMKTLKNEIVKICPKGRVNVVSPGWTLTEMTKESLNNKELVNKVFKTVPMRKIASVEDCTNAIVFLASDKMAFHSSGTVLRVDGGMEGRCLV